MATTYTAADTAALVSFLAARKAEVEAWVAEDSANRWAGYPTQDLSHWHAMGIFTVEQYEIDSLRGEFWDAYKSIHGIKPRWMDVNNWDKATLESQLESLYKLREANALAAARREHSEAERKMREANALAAARRKARRKHDAAFTLRSAFAQAGL